MVASEAGRGCVLRDLGGRKDHQRATALRMRSATVKKRCQKESGLMPSDGINLAPCRWHRPLVHHHPMPENHRPIPRDHRRRPAEDSEFLEHILLFGWY